MSIGEVVGKVDRVTGRVTGYQVMLVGTITVSVFSVSVVSPSDLSEMLSLQS
jgi:hypothetical protein